MPDNIYTDQLTAKLADFEKRISDLEKTRQFYYSDWREINKVYCTYLTANSFTYSDPAGGTNATDVFRAGDRVQITQGANTYVYTVIGVNSSGAYVNIYGGTTPALVNASIDYIAICRETNIAINSGGSYRTYYQFTPVLTASGAMTVAGGSPTGVYYQIGTLSFLYIYFDGATLGGVADTAVYASVPAYVLSDIADVWATNHPVVIKNNNVWEVGKISGAGNTITINRINNTNWTLSANTSARFFVPLMLEGFTP